MKKIFLIAVLAVSAPAILLTSSCSHKKTKVAQIPTIDSTDTKNADSLAEVITELNARIAELEADSATKVIVKNWTAYAEYVRQNALLLQEQSDSESVALDREKEATNESWSTYRTARSKPFLAFRSADPDIYGKWADSEMLRQYEDEENETEGFDVVQEQIDSSKNYIQFKKIDAEAYTIKLATDSVAGVTYQADKANAQTKYQEQRENIWQQFLQQNQ